MKLTPWIGLITLTALNSPADARVKLTRSADAVVLENSRIRIELPRKRNFHPVLLIDKRNAGKS